jgi:hypothetical protein
MTSVLATARRPDVYETEILNIHVIGDILAQLQVSTQERTDWIVK